MTWKKKGFIFNANNHADWAVKGAMIPTPIHLNESTLRVFLTFLDSQGVGRTGFVDLNKDNLGEVINVSSKPMFEIGEPGTFDENGCLTCSVIQNEQGDYHFYYAGFELGTKIRYRLLSGLAISDSNFNLKKKYATPILERSQEELFFRGGPFCMISNGVYKMWYAGGSGWIIRDGKTLPQYDIKYLESTDGIHWGTRGHTCITVEYEDEFGFGRPYILHHNNRYKMFYSIRKKHIGYRLGYAESEDGIAWTRMDDRIDLDISENGFDNETICYASVIEVNNKLIMFYNGNGFGATGFGWAESSID